VFLSYITSNPGCTAADLHRARGFMYAHGHHRFSYDTVARLIAAGHVRAKWEGGRKLLFAVERASKAA
jgi:hypothetical protein